MPIPEVKPIAEVKALAPVKAAAPIKVVAPVITPVAAPIEEVKIEEPLPPVL
jgi:hypothetical protein